MNYSITSLFSLLSKSTAPGFSKFEVKPQQAGDLTWAEGHYDAVVGRIVSEWKIEGTYFYLNVGVPANTHATIYAPSFSGKPVLESGLPVVKSPGIKFTKYSDGYAVFEAVSGSYSFKSVFQK